MMRSCSMASVAEPAPTLSATSCQSKPVGASRSSSGVTSLVVTSALSGDRLLLGRCLLPCFQLSDASLQRGDFVGVALSRVLRSLARRLLQAEAGAVAALGER